MKLYKKVLLAAAVFAVLVVLTFFWLIFAKPVVSDYASRVNFNSNGWKQVKGSHGSAIRVKMVDDLLSKHRLVGKSRSEIDTLLGTPPKTGYFRNYDYVYWLGPERGFLSIDSEWLGIKFRDNIVIEVGILRD